MYPTAIRHPWPIEFQYQLIIVEIDINPGRNLIVGVAWHFEINRLPNGVLRRRATFYKCVEEWTAKATGRSKGNTEVPSDWLKDGICCRRKAVDDFAGGRVINVVSKSDVALYQFFESKMR